MQLSDASAPRYGSAMTLQESIGAALAQLRGTRSLQSVARRFNRSHTWLMKIEAGTSGTPLNDLRALARALGGDLLVLVQPSARTDDPRVALMQAAAEMTPETAAAMLELARAWPHTPDVDRRAALYTARLRVEEAANKLAELPTSARPARSAGQ